MTETSTRFDRALERVTTSLQFLSGGDAPAPEHANVAEPAEELRAALVELQAARDELMRQNEELGASRQAVAEERDRYSQLFQLAPQPYFVTDVQGVIREVNLSGTELLGLGLGPAAENSLPAYVHPDQRPAFFQAMRKILRTGAIDGSRADLRSRDGTMRHVSFTARAVPRQRPREIWWILRDVTAQVERMRSRSAAESDAGRGTAGTHDSEDDLLQVIPQELRTPLTVILGNCEILARLGIGLLPTEDVARAFADIHDEAIHMYGVVENLAVLSELRNQPAPPTQATRLELAIEHTVSVHRRQYPSRDVRVVCAPRLPRVRAREDYAEQAVRNFLAHAEAVTPDTAPIEVTVDTGENEVRVRVGDRGPDLPTDAAIGELEPAGTASGPGAARNVSLELSVCRRLIEAQGGRVWARSRPGGGTEYGMALPVVGDSSSL